MLKDSYRRFPDDEEFKREIVARDLYNFRTRNYLLAKLENDGVVARMRLIGRTRFDECKHPGRASLVGSRAANYRALFWLPDAFEPLPYQPRTI